MARGINQKKIKKELMKRLSLDAKELKRTMLFNYFDYLAQFEVVWDFKEISYDDIYEGEKEIEDVKTYNSYNWNAIVPAIHIFFKYKNMDYMLVSFLMDGDPRGIGNYTSPMILPFNQEEFLEIDYDFVICKKYGNYEYTISRGFSEDDDIYYEDLEDSENCGYLNDGELTEEHEEFLELCIDTNFDIFFKEE